MTAGPLGREHPLALLRSRVRRALDSHGGLVLITGEAGIGKTTLVTEAVEEARRHGAPVLAGSCWESDNAPGHWPWVQVLRGLRRVAGPRRWAEALEAAGPGPELLLDGVADRKGTGGGPPMDDFALHDSVTTALVALSHHHPLVVVLEDLHRADPDSLRLLEFAARHTWFERVLLIGTYRDVETESPDHPLHPPLTALPAAAGTTLTLGGLEPEDTGALIARVHGRIPAPEVVAEVHRRTGGNPFFIEETARLWSAGAPAGAIASGVREAIRRRLGLLPAGVAELLGRAAVLGRRFRPALLAAVDGRPLGEVERLLARAEAARLITTGGPPGGAAPAHATDPPPRAFIHDLVRETLYEALPRAERLALHAAVVHALEAEGPQEVEGAEGAEEGTAGRAADGSTRVAEVAEHAHRAGEALDPGTAVELFAAAALDARLRFAPREAVEHHRRAHRVAVAGGLPIERRVRVALALGGELLHAGEIAEGWRVLADAEELARRVADPAPAIRTALMVYGARELPGGEALRPRALRAADRRRGPAGADAPVVGADGHGPGVTLPARPDHGADGYVGGGRDTDGGPGAGGDRTADPDRAEGAGAGDTGREAVGRGAPRGGGPRESRGPGSPPVTRDADVPGSNTLTPSTPTTVPTDGDAPMTPAEEEAVVLRLTDALARHAHSLEDEEGLTFALWARHQAIWGPGTARERLRLTGGLRELAARRGMRLLEFYATSLRWVALLELDDPRYTEQFREQLAVAAPAASPETSFNSLMDRCLIDGLQGRFAEAEEALRRAEPLVTGPGREHPFGAGVLHHLRWSLALLRERKPPRPPPGPADDSPLTGSSSPLARLREGLAALERNDLVAARRELAATADPLPRMLLPIRMRLAAEVAMREGDEVAVARCVADLEPYSGQWLVGVFGCDIGGPVDLLLSRLRRVAGDTERAVRAARSACRSAERMGSPPWLLRSRAALAEALLARGAAGDREAARELLGRVAREAAGAGLEHTAERARRLRAGGAAPVRVVPAGDGPTAVPAGAAPGPGASGGAAGDGVPPPVNEFRREGPVWRLGYGGRVVHLPDAKGLGDLHRLLGAPGRDVPAVHLLAPGADPEVVAAHRMGGDPVLDEEAKLRYRRRLTELDEEIDRAALRGADGAASALERERAALLAELRGAAGLAGRGRRLGDAAERARKTVTARIRDTLRKLDDRHPELAAHLRASVSTGSDCRYLPERETTWRL
ncbi:AAA family ATPase [Streptomyces sp. ST2-7A]|uniref:AAA family ATPase n=1 Tax=Streptomyces sp. ST2-7A TaxID=2907214 RepID=UPI001F394A9F|nr:AAA family ATPase [Streptomyces sp. ST2-7A]MCE7079824.1 AAA family ATPase [Streptomyces sp. ST2-7A]